MGHFIVAIILIEERFVHRGVISDLVGIDSASAPPISTSKSISTARSQMLCCTFNKLLCKETTNDLNFTFGELSYVTGGVRGPLQGHEAFHCLRGWRILRVWPAEVDDAEPVSIPLGPGSEYYVRGDVTGTVENTGDEPLFGIGFLCHVDRPCHAHAFSHSRANFWIHAGYYAGAGRPTAGVFDLPEVATWRRPR
ncbi:MAG: hypothetical protein VX792_00965 [Candidatus Latescibacterota bacterium]|nr:hypothetical protein [Candidatus Latescibacterota bacterium]